MRKLWLVLVCAAALPSTGCCMMLGNTQTARTPEKGTSEVGMTFGATTYEFDATSTDPDTGETESETVRVIFPAVIPEIPFQVALDDDVAIGGRIAPLSLGLEAEVKWRFLHEDRLHMAIAPALNYQAFLIVSGVGARLPLLVTYDVADNLSFTTSLHGSYGVWTLANDFDNDDENKGASAFDGSLASFGMTTGLEIRGESFFLRPAVQFTRYQSRFGDDSNGSFEPFNSYGVMIGVGWVIGRTKKHLDRIEKKVDRVIENQERREPSPAPPPPPPEGDNEAAVVPRSPPGIAPG